MTMKKRNYYFSLRFSNSFSVQRGFRCLMAAAMVLAVAACGSLPEHRRPPKSYAIVQETEVESAFERDLLPKNSWHIEWR
jgi:hypothetical protein